MQASKPASQSATQAFTAFAETGASFATLGLDDAEGGGWADADATSAGELDALVAVTDGKGAIRGGWFTGGGWATSRTVDPHLTPSATIVMVTRTFRRIARRFPHVQGAETSLRDACPSDRPRACSTRSLVEEADRATTWR